MVTDIYRCRCAIIQSSLYKLSLEHTNVGTSSRRPRDLPLASRLDGGPAASRSPTASKTPSADAIRSADLEAQLGELLESVEEQDAKLRR